MSSIGSNIRRYRELAGLSQEQLAKTINKTRSAVSQYESDTIVPRMGVIEDLAIALSVDKAKLLDTSILPSELSCDEMELLDVYRQAEPWERELILNHAKMVYLHAKPE